MKQITLMEKYPVFTIQINKNETTYKSVDEIIEYLRDKISNHPVAIEIGLFDHYTHTSSIKDSVIDPNIKDAKNLVFCFGKALPKPEVMAVRPRSFGVADIGDSFVVSFLEAPNPEGNAAMEEWAKAIVNA
jgi:hypothetical protein